MITKTQVFFGLLCIFCSLIIPFIKEWLGDKVNSVKRGVEDKELWQKNKSRVYSLLIIFGCIVIFNVIAANANWDWWARIWKHDGHLFSFIWIGVIYATFAWFNSEKVAITKIFSIAVFLGSAYSIYTVGIKDTHSLQKEIQHIEKVKWSGETEVGKDWTQLRTPPDKANFTFYVVNPEGTDVSFSLHGGTGYYLLEDGTHTKTVTKRNGLAVERLRKSGWEGEVNGIVAKSNNGKIVVVKCVED